MPPIFLPFFVALCGTACAAIMIVEWWTVQRYWGRRSTEPGGLALWAGYTHAERRAALKEVERC